MLYTSISYILEINHNETFEKFCHTIQKNSEKCGEYLASLIIHGIYQEMLQSREFFCSRSWSKKAESVDMVVCNPVKYSGMCNRYFEGEQL